MTTALQRAAINGGSVDPESVDGKALNNQFEPAELYMGMCEQPHAYEWLVDNWIPRVGVTNFSGHGESGKTYCMLDLIISALLGKRWLGLETREINSALFLTAEQSLNNIQLRLDRMLPRYGYDGSGYDSPRHHFVKEWLSPQDKTFAYWSTRDRAEHQPFWHFLRPSFEVPLVDRGPSDYGMSLQNWLVDRRCEFFCIDSILHFYQDAIVDKGKVLYVLNDLGAVAEDAQMAICFLFHPTMSGLEAKSGPMQGMGGAMEWHNQVDCRLLLEYDEETDARALIQKKSREGPRQGDVELVWKDTGFGKKGLRDQPDGFKIAQRIIQDCNTKGVLLSANPISRSYYPRLMFEHSFNREKRRRLITARSKEDRREVWENLIHELMKRGLVEIGEVKTTDRHKRDGLRLNELSPCYESCGEPPAAKSLAAQKGDVAAPLAAPLLDPPDPPF